MPWKKEPKRRATQGHLFGYSLKPRQDLCSQSWANLLFMIKFIKTQMFQITTLQEVILLQEDYLVTVDLNDTYFHIPKYPLHRKRLRCVMIGVHYQFRVLPYGIKSAPMVFNNTLAVVGTPPQMAGHY